MSDEQEYANAWDEILSDNGGNADAAVLEAVSGLLASVTDYLDGHIPDEDEDYELTAMEFAAGVVKHAIERADVKEV